MNDENLKITALKEKVKAIEEEVGLAVMFHETWKPTVYDEDLLTRMGYSFATHTFSIIRTALRREMLLALMRLWDFDNRTIGIPAVVSTLNDVGFFDAFVEYRAQRHESSRISLTPELGLSTRFADGVKDAIVGTRAKLCELVKKYAKGGSHYSVLEKLIILRQVSLAHRQTEPKKPGRADATDEEIESFYQDNLEIVRLLLSLILAKAHDLTESAEVYEHHARFFWAVVRGERTEGHPDYRPLPPPQALMPAD